MARPVALIQAGEHQIGQRTKVPRAVGLVEFEADPAPLDLAPHAAQRQAVAVHRRDQPGA
nr:hypothetical protein [Mycolicibacter algericus]